MRQTVWFRDLGKMAYKNAWELQEQLLQANVQVKSQLRQLELAGNQSAADLSSLETQHHLLFVEHPPVYTLGKSGDAANILIPLDEMKQRGIEYYATNRGGDITFHGPGQLVGYPLLDLEKFETDIGKYLRRLEEVIIHVLAQYGLKGERSAGETGVWLEPGVPGQERKICAMGVRCSRWITMHGFALNVNTDLGYFDHIIPCGIRNKQVTSIAKELGSPVDFAKVQAQVTSSFEEIFDVQLVTNQ